MENFKITDDLFEEMQKTAQVATSEEIAARQKPSESFDWSEGGRTVDTSTAKIIAKDRAENEQGAIKTLLEKIKSGS